MINYQDADQEDMKEMITYQEVYQGDRKEMITYQEVNEKDGRKWSPNKKFIRKIERK